LEIFNDIDKVKGVGPKNKDIFNKCGIYTITDLLLYFPRDYENIKIINSIIEGLGYDLIIIKVKVTSIKKDFNSKNGIIISEARFSDELVDLTCKWFNQPFIKNKLEINKDCILVGKLELVNKIYYINNPIIKFMDSFMEKTEVIEPKYRLAGGISKNLIIKTINNIFEKIQISENLSNTLIENYKLMSLHEAIRTIHQPNTLLALQEARKRLKFQELFTFSMKLLMIKSFINKEREGISFKMSTELKSLKESLPFELTQSQAKVIREILTDEKSNLSMNRLLQGDVGSGKTVVSAIAIFNVIKNGFQAALMAPTEILAQQHYTEFIKLFEGYNIEVRLLSGSISAKEKVYIKSALKEGKIDLIIGTHAILEEDVLFKNLGMVVTDEQHRFGVVQRKVLSEKGKNVEMLIMTATPIPRTLALFLYGDLDVSTITELPLGRKPIETRLLDIRHEEKAYEFALSQIRKNNQVYIVCPYIDEDIKGEISSVKEVYNKLNKFFDGINIGMLHSKMSSREKNMIMEDFIKGNLKVIVSTTVIEVGINVPNATLMIIENAERFGLSQLHQLRGRVGRGNDKSYCIMLSNLSNDTIKKRLNVIEENDNGFTIAEMDLKLRGSGDVFGIKQHGETDFLIADPFEDFELFKVANFEARFYISSNKEEDIIFRESVLKLLEKDNANICFN